MNSIVIKTTGIHKRNKGKRLLDFLLTKKIPLLAGCGGQGRCGLCRVKIIGKIKPPDEIESLLIPANALKKGYRLACRYFTKEDVEVIIPKTPRLKTTIPLSGLALDIGTTILKGAVIDLKKRKVIRTAKIYNPQNLIGGDVITRIDTALKGKYKLLRNLLFSGLATLKKELGVNAPLFTTIVGNPVMLSFYLNKSLLGLASYPFRSEIKGQIFLKNPPRYIFPVIGGFVGGDTTAGLLASQKYWRAQSCCLYIDLGTNGEVALITDRKILVASTAAGPALEGVGITCGSFVAPGVIVNLTYRNGFKFHTLGRRKSHISICASGLIDLLAILLNLGWLREDGRLIKEVNLNGIKILPEDIRKLQLAIGAIHTGVEILLRKMGIRPNEIKEVILTGEFGSHLKPESLFRVGLLPEGVQNCRWEKDLPLKGAIMVLTDNQALSKVERIKERCEHLELALEPEFPKIFVSALKLAPWS